MVVAFDRSLATSTGSSPAARGFDILDGDESCLGLSLEFRPSLGFGLAPAKP